MKIMMGDEEEEDRNKRCTPLLLKLLKLLTWFK